MGTNIQYIKDKKIQLKILGITLLEDNHTSEYLRTVIKKVLDKYGIKIQKIHNCTTDNGANMLKLTELLQKDELNYLSLLKNFELESMSFPIPNEAEESKESEDLDNSEAEDSEDEEDQTDLSDSEGDDTNQDKFFLESGQSDHIYENDKIFDQEDLQGSSGQGILAAVK